MLAIVLFSEVSQLVLLTQSMMEQGLSEEEIKKIWGRNFLRVLKENIGVLSIKKIAKKENGACGVCLVFLG